MILTMPRLTRGTWYHITWTPPRSHKQCFRGKFHDNQFRTGYLTFATEPFVGLIPVPLGLIEECMEEK